MDILQATLKSVFGFEAFRTGQKEAIEALLEKKRLLAIQPTGYGKSLLYQLPSYLFDGLTVVISPLLALMRDQLEKLNNQFHIPAASINSDQDDLENDEACKSAKSGSIKVLFVAPEQLDHVDRLSFLSSLPISLIVVDEAHCISTWGHDFRPSYRQIIHFVNANPDAHILALTATCSARVQEDIQKQLKRKGQEVTVFRESMNRPNISLQVIPTSGTSEKLAICEQYLTRLEGSGLIYCATRENTELVAEYLKSRGLNVAAYHAGFSPEEKRFLQQDFIKDSFKALVATNALGMGIDKPNLRYIIHFDIPGSITSYYQEVGRAGRDGLPATGILLYHAPDLKIQEHFIESALPEKSDFDRVLEAASETCNLKTIKQKTGLHPTTVIVVIAELIEQGFLQKKSLDGLQVYERVEQSRALDLSRYEVQHQVKKRELEAMKGYAASPIACRMQTLRQALGDESPSSCTHCDVCRAQKVAQIPNGDTARIDSWLSVRAIPIGAMKQQGIVDGISLLDARQRLPLFVHFMRYRQEAEHLKNELLDLLKQQLSLLQFASCVMLPSNTWKQRDSVAKFIQEECRVPVFCDLLIWNALPEARQGELLNNDQRQHNVHQRMLANEEASKLPPGPILLFDDYIGSGATIREAARAVRIKTKTKQPFIPFTIACVKWRLGKQGYV